MTKIYEGIIQLNEYDKPCICGVKLKSLGVTKVKGLFEFTRKRKAFEIFADINPGYKDFIQII